jgi:hypothetical protein
VPCQDGEVLGPFRVVVTHRGRYKRRCPLFDGPPGPYRVDGGGRTGRACGIEALRKHAGEPVNGAAEIPQLAPRRVLAILKLGHAGERLVPLTAYYLVLARVDVHRRVVRSAGSADEWTRGAGVAVYSRPVYFAARRRRSFISVRTPMRLTGATGSPVNPLCIL